MLDTLSIAPNTFRIIAVDTSYYTLDEVNATLRWKKRIDKDSVRVQYRVLPIKLNATFQRLSYDSIVNNFSARPTVISSAQKYGNQALFDFGDMNYNGSFGRAMSFGNNQDVVVNSQFNLQLNGIIGDSIQVAAAITDNNIPIQPDGTTRQLNEFDRVWLQFKKSRWEANLGDIDVRQNRYYFLNFYKRLQGISYSNTIKAGKTGYNRYLVTGAVAKGKFTRNTIQGQEGNQGPYRLQGANSEFFFIVLAGTERVFIDGILMQRGEDQDYVINYNTAEVTFTPRRMITKDSRIQVEFEYAERSYLNSMLYATNELQLSDRFTINVAAYSNADAKNSPINQQLDTRQRQFLQNIGDSVSRAFFPNAAIDTFDTNKILYAQVDTIVNGLQQVVYRYSTHPDSARYNLSFIEVGIGRGNYVPFFNGANGKVYKWVAPVNDVPQGNYEPATYLVTPKKQQVFTVNSLYEIAANTHIAADVGISKYDVNTYATKHKNNDNGYAGKFTIEDSRKFYNKGRALQVNSVVGYEIVTSNFRPVERLRAVEFYRDWGLELIPGLSNEHLPVLSLQVIDSSNNYIRYQSSAYIRNDGYSGYRQEVTNYLSSRGWVTNNQLRYTRINKPGEQGYFLRPVVDVNKILPALKNLSFGVNYQLEHNEIKNTASGLVSPSSFSFDILSAYIKSNIAKENRWMLSYFTRSDKLPQAANLVRVNRSHNYMFSTELLANPKHQLRVQTTYRWLHISNAALSNLAPEKTLLGRAEYIINEWKGLLTGSTLYEIGSGQEQRRDFSYLEVPAGRGEYAWIDYDNDGIAQLNEFEIAQFPDQARYIRVFTPTNQFIKANYTQFNYALSLQPAVITATQGKFFTAIIKRLSFQSSLQTAKKDAGQQILLNPFAKSTIDTTLITLNSLLNNTLSINRRSAKWGIDITNTNNFIKALLTYGFESRNLKNFSLRARYNPARNFTIEMIQKRGEHILLTPSFDNRNYHISLFQSEPKLVYTSGTTFRMAGSYIYLQKVNKQQYGGQKSTSRVINVEGKYNAVNNASINGRFTYNYLRYSGNPSTTVGYIMLDALVPGNNVLWRLDFTKRLGNNLELNFEYEGRKPGQTRTIHTGRASLRAIL